jgi:hypothetical protein
VAVSEHDKRYMRKLAEASAELEKEPLPPMSPEDRKWFCAWINEDRAKHGLPPFLEEDIERADARSASDAASTDHRRGDDPAA